LIGAMKNEKLIKEPESVYAVAFVDGQNLFHCARDAFGYTYPNFDCRALAKAVCQLRKWNLTQVRFYTGVPTKDRDPKWHQFWARKTLRMARAGVHVVTRPLRYAEEMLEDGRFIYVPREKGIDVRIAVDILRLAYAKSFDVALVFSQDQDLAEVATEFRDISRRQERWIKMASAFPVGTGTENRRGINGTDWIQVDQAMYDLCLDPNE
jgi:uncharacterized LabA/DUF88 family protein